MITVRQPLLIRSLLIFLFLSFILLVQFARINRPYAGHYGSYQGTVMASIARNMARENFSDLLRPKTDMLILENVRSLHLNQYPFPSLFAALGYRFMGGTLEFWGRFQAIIFNLLSILLIGLLTARIFNERIGWIAAIIYGLSPYTLVYGQALMSEPFSLVMLLFSFWILFQTEYGPAKEKSWPLIVSALALGISLTGRIHFIFFYPLFIYGLLQQEKSLRRVALFTFLAFLMPLAWYGYTFYATVNWSNVHTSIFLQTGASSLHVDYSLWDYIKRISKIFFVTLLTPLLFPFFLWGWKPLAGYKKGFWFVSGGMLAGFLMIVLALRKVADHDFYLYGMFPFVVMITACGVNHALESFPILKKKGILGIGILIYVLFSIRLFSGPLYKIPLDEQRAVRVAEAVRVETLPEGRLIVASLHPAVFLFYADRPCWNMDLSNIGRSIDGYLKNPRFRKKETASIDQMENAMKNPITWLELLRSKGADYLVAPDKKDLDSQPQLYNYLREHFSILSPTDANYVLFRLKR